MRKQYISSLFFAILLLVIVFYFYHQKDNLILFTRIGVKDILIIVTLSVTTFFFLSIQFHTIIKIFGVALAFKEWFGLTVVSTMISYYTPVKAGMVARAYYLKKIHQFSYSNYISLLSASYLINLLVASGTSSWLSFFSYHFYSQNEWPIFVLSIVLLMITVACAILVLFCSSVISFNPGNALLNFMTDLMGGFRILMKKKSILAKIAGIQLVLIFIMALKLYWSFKAIGIQVSFVHILIIQSLTTFSTVVSITPGNLGVKEGIIGSFAFMLNIPATDAIFAATVDRGISMVVTFALGLIFSKILMKKYSADSSLAPKS